MNINNIPLNNRAQSQLIGTFGFKVMAKNTILDGKFRISLRQSWKIIVGTLGALY